MHPSGRQECLDSRVPSPAHSWPETGDLRGNLVLCGSHSSEPTFALALCLADQNMPRLFPGAEEPSLAVEEDLLWWLIRFTGNLLDGPATGEARGHVAALGLVEPAQGG